MRQVGALVSTLFRQFFGSQLRRNMSSGVIGMAVNIIVLVVSVRLYLHFIGYEEYGIWLILTAVLSFAQIGMVGINQSVMKLVAEDYGKGDIQGAASYVTMAFAVLCTVGFTVIIGIVLFRGQIVSLFKLSGDNAEMVAWLLPFVGALSVYVLIVQVVNSVLSGIGRMDIANYILLAGRVSAAGVSLILLMFGLGVKSLLIGNSVSYVLIHLMSNIFIRRNFEIRFLRFSNWDIARLKKLFQFGGVVSGSALMLILLDPFNKMMLSRYVGVASVPVYDIASRASAQIRSIFETSFRALMPEISKLSANMDEMSAARVRMVVKRAFKIIFFLGVPVFIFFFLTGEFLLKLWLGKEYVAILPYAFRIMVTASLISLFGVPAYYTHMGAGNVIHCFVSLALIATLNVLIVFMMLFINPSLIEKNIYYAFLFGTLISTGYLIWKQVVFFKHSQKSKISVL